MQVWIGPDRSKRLSLLKFIHSLYMKVERLSALRSGHLYPKKYFWYSFLLEAESTTGPQCGQKDFVNEKSQ
jgi:hypothetical protein